MASQGAGDGFGKELYEASVANMPDVGKVTTGRAGDLWGCEWAIV